jgi:hypothetical protein
MPMREPVGLLRAPGGPSPAGSSRKAPSFSFGFGARLVSAFLCDSASTALPFP